MSLQFKRHAALVGALIVTISLFIFGLGNTRVISYAINNKPLATETPSHNYRNTQALFDESIVHQIQVIMPQKSYDMLIRTYQQTQEKDYFEADVIIDGVRINKVGIRLKGNASLRTAIDNATNGAQRAAGGPPEGGGPPGGGNMSGCFVGNGNAQGGMPKPQAPPAGMPKPEFGGRGGGPGGDNDPTVPTAVPYLIKFDEFVKGQRYQGHTTLAIRNYGISSNAAVLHEPLTYYAAHVLGIPAPGTAYAGVRFNNGAEKFYSLSSLVDEDYLQAYFPKSSGVLYKAELGANLKYNGEAPENYSSCYDQKTRVKEADMRPIIDMIRFINQADDATFERDLGNYFEIDSIINYLALNNLLVNVDSLAGMGNNYYLYYNDQSKRFSLLLWDANESLGKLAGGANAARYDLYYEGTNTGPAPAVNNAAAGANGAALGGGPPMMNGENILKKRFLSNPTFRKRYEEALKKQYTALFVNDAFTPQITTYSNLVHRVNPTRPLVNIDSYDKAVANVQAFLNARKAFLQTVAVLQ